MAETADKGKLEPGLYIVATPIGNLGDVTRRARDVLAQCDAIACEDTRVTGKLMHHLGLKNRLIRYDDHADERKRAGLIGLARTGAIALVSDAGTPLVSDPGYRLVRDAQEAGVAITALPGASAVLTALAISGLPCDRFLFAGFMPGKAKARADLLSEFSEIRATLVFYDTAPRLAETLAVIHAAWPGREIAVARELTKRHEECRRGSAASLLNHYRDHPPKGEIVLLVGPPAQDEVRPVDIDEELRDALADMKPSQAAAHVARRHGLDRKTLYARAMELKT